MLQVQTLPSDFGLDASLRWSRSRDLLSRYSRPPRKRFCTFLPVLKTWLTEFPPPRDFRGGILQSFGEVRGDFRGMRSSLLSMLIGGRIFLIGGKSFYSFYYRPSDWGATIAVVGILSLDVGPRRRHFFPVLECFLKVKGDGSENEVRWNVCD